MCTELLSAENTGAQMPHSENTFLYPVLLALKNKNCVVIGGGEVAARKARSLLDAGARLTIVAPAVSASVAELAAADGCRVIQDVYRHAYLAQAFLAVAATSDCAVNRQVCADAPCLCNNATEPQLGNFTIPASFSAGSITVAVASSGMPAYARLLKNYLRGRLTPAFGEFNEFLLQQRRAVRLLASTPEERTAFWRQALDPAIINLLEAGQLQPAKERIIHAVDSFRAQSQNGPR